MKKFYPPKFKESKFNCIYCDVYAQQNWGQLEYESTTNKSGIWYCMCEHCKEISFWFNENPIIPSDAPVPQPHEDMPTSCIEDYYEARDIVSRSPKAGAAIIRLCIQKLMVELGEKGKNINEDIGNLVKKGLPVEVQQALDYCRVVGNNAVHPGEINLDDDPNIAHSMFEMINFIVEDRITRPKKIESLYSALPEGAITAVKKRDN